MPQRLTRGQALVGALSIDAQDITVSDDLSVGDDAAITGDLTAGTLAVGGGTVIKKIVKGTATVTLPAASGATLEATFTVTGSAAGDVIVVNPPTTLDSNIVFAGAIVSAANTVTVRIGDLGGTYAGQADQVFTYLWIDVT